MTDPTDLEALQLEDARQHVNRGFLRGAVALGARQLLVHGANLAGAITLARILSPAQYGVFAVVTFLIFFLGTFGGTGLAANLIREHPMPEERVFRAVYTFQWMFVGIAAAILAMLAPWLAVKYHLGSHGTRLFELTALSLLATTAMVPPQIRMERNLDFQRLAIIEVVQALCFNGAAIGFAMGGFGAESFGLALLIRSLAGVAIAQILQPTLYVPLPDWSLAGPHLKFGLYYQGAQILSMVKDSITPLLIGFLAGSAGVGYLGWAGTLAAYPALVLAVLQRLYLPTFARLQHDPVHYSRFLEQVLWLTNAVAAPLVVMLVALIHPVTVLVFGAKWLVAVPLFYLLSVSSVFVPTSTPVQSMMNASGKANWATWFAAMWMVLTWGLGWPLSLWKGPFGVALAMALVQLSNLVLFHVAQRLVRFRVLRNVGPPWTLAALAGAGVWTATRVHPVSGISLLVLYGLGGVLLYGVAIAALQRNRIAQLRSMAA